MHWLVSLCTRGIEMSMLNIGNGNNSVWSRSYSGARWLDISRSGCGRHHRTSYRENQDWQLIGRTSQQPRSVLTFTSIIVTVFSWFVYCWIMNIETFMNYRKIWKDLPVFPEVRCTEKTSIKHGANRNSELFQSNIAGVKDKPSQYWNKLANFTKT